MSRSNEDWLDRAILRGVAVNDLRVWFAKMSHGERAKRLNDLRSTVDMRPRDIERRRGYVNAITTQHRRLNQLEFG